MTEHKEGEVIRVNFANKKVEGKFQPGDFEIGDVVRMKKGKEVLEIAIVNNDEFYETNHRLLEHKQIMKILELFHAENWKVVNLYGRYKENDEDRMQIEYLGNDPIYKGLILAVEKNSFQKFTKQMEIDAEKNNIRIGDKVTIVKNLKDNLADSSMSELLEINGKARSSKELNDIEKKLLSNAFGFHWVVLEKLVGEHENYVIESQYLGTKIKITIKADKIKK